MKIYAKQVPPEYQESPLFFGDWPENVFIFGNRRFDAHDERLEDIRGSLDAIACALDDMRGGYGWYKDENLNVLLQDYFQRERPYTRAERLHFVQLANSYCENVNDESDILCAALELITGREWEYTTIRGCCQGDWQYIIYPAEYGREWLRDFETEYFNTGDEWTVDVDGCGEYVYTHAWRDDDIRAEIASAIGADPGAVVLCKFTGWSRTAAYMEV